MGEVFEYPDQDLLCAVAALSEGATWAQIRQMAPSGGAAFTRAMGAFIAHWVPEFVPDRRLISPACQLAAVVNYVRLNHPNYVAPEWMAN